MVITIHLFFLVVASILLRVATSAEDVLFPSFSQLGNTLIDHPRFLGSLVEISADGNRIAIGAPHAVFIYENDSQSDLDSYRLVHELMLAGIAHISVLADGRAIAVQRYDTNLTTVEVYQLGALAGGDLNATMLGDPISACSKAGVIKLAQTSSSSVFGARIWCVVSCESADNVGIFWFNEGTGSWQRFSLLRGEHPGFGSSLGIYTGNPKFLQIGISSPNYDNQRGLVQIYYFNSKGESAQLRDDITGKAEGGLFGFSMQMNTGTIGRPSLVIGAPRDNGGRVYVYGWNRQNETDPMGWEMIGKTTGMPDGDQFGKSVAISSGPTLRIAVASINQRCNNTGLVSLYEFEEGPKMTHAGDFLIGESNPGVIDGDQMGLSLALGRSESGLIIVAGMEKGIVKGVVYNSNQPLLSLSETSSCDLLPLHNSSNLPIPLDIAKSPTQAPTSLTFMVETSEPTAMPSGALPVNSPTQGPTTNQKSPVAQFDAPDDESDVGPPPPKNSWPWIIISGVSTILFCVIITILSKRPCANPKEEELDEDDDVLGGV